MIRSILKLLAFILLLLSFSCTKEATSDTTAFKLDVVTFTLDNGLQVIVNLDRSNPVVALALTSHVESAREIQGLTGFAYLFKRLLFLESENLGKGGLDKMSAHIGGSGANESMSRDRTNYFYPEVNRGFHNNTAPRYDKDAATLTC
jgi:zinc protease